MGKTLHKLSDAHAKSDKLKPGRHSDGGGLYLNVSPAKTKSWLFMWSVMVTKPDGKRGQRRHEMGLGAYPAVTLSSARTKAAECRQIVAEGGNPIAERDKEDEKTFEQAATAFMDGMDEGWKNDKHRAQWRSTLKTYCKPINPKPVSSITTEDVLSCLTPIWAKKTETATRVRGRIERVLDYCKVKGWRQGDNPALWRGHLRNALQKPSAIRKVKHHTALPYADVPDFVQRIRSAEAMSARALEFGILCAARTGEIIGAEWSEVDLDEAVWIVPADRMKAKKEHRVPLSKRAVKMLKDLKAAGGGKGYIFPGERKGKPLSNMAMAMLLKRLKVPVTVHGFRSSFRDWCGDATSFPREIAEAALAHRVGDSTENAYRRSDALERRRKLMQAWADFVEPKQKGAKL